MKKIISAIVLSAALITTSQAGLDNLFYQPDGKTYATPDKEGYVYEDVEFLSKDGTKLSGWFIPARGASLGTVIHFHGNAQNMSAHYSFVSWLPANGFNLFLFDYRGYGKSEGKLSRKGVYQDSVAAVEYMKSRSDIDQSKLILFGQSLGGANALAVLGNNQFDGIVGVVSESAFSSYKSVATEHAGVFKPLAFLLMGNQYSPKQSVHKISPIPLIIIHGTQDRVVSYSHAEKLYEAAKEPKSLWTIAGGHHTQALGAYRTTYAPRLLTLFKQWVAREISDERPHS